MHHSSSSEGVAAKSASQGLTSQGIDNHKLSYGHTTEPSLHPVKLHTSDQPKQGLPSGSTRSFQPETPEHLQEDQERALSTIYSGFSYSGHSSGDRASPTAAGQSEAMPGQGAGPAHDSSADACPPGISPFSLAPLPLSRAGSESLPASPRHEQATSHRGRTGDVAAKPPSRLRQQAGPEQHPGVASRSASGLMKSYPGLEHISPVQSMLKKSLSRSLSSWLQSSLGAQHAANSKSWQQSAELTSKAMSNALSAQLYCPGLEGAVSNWTQQALHDKPHAQPSGNPASEAAAGRYPGVERAISNWAQQNQHDSSYTQPSSNPASRASSGLYPGLERAISSWAQQAHQELPQPQSTARAMSGMSDLPGLEQAISSWAQQVHCQARSDNSSPEAKPTPATATAMSGLLEGLYPGLEKALCNWAQQSQDSLCHESDSVPLAARAMSGMSDMPGLESDMPCPTQQTEQLHEALSRAVSAMSECLYMPGLEKEILACAQQAQQAQNDNLEKQMTSAASMPRTTSEVSEAWCPGLERTISNWAQQAQHDIIRSLQSVPAVQSSTLGVPECLVSGLERAMTDFAQQAHCEILARLQSNASDCLYCPGLEPSEDPPSPEQQPAGTEPSSSHRALAQATGEAILAAARMDDPAAAAKTVTEAVNDAVAGAGQAEAVREAAKAAVTEAVPKAPGSSPAVDEASHFGLSRASSGSPKVLLRAGSGSPKAADQSQLPRAAQASKMLKVHSRDLGQHQQNKHAKLHQKGGPGQGLKAEPVAAENAGSVDMSPLSLQGGAKGVGMQSPAGKTADRMAQALRQRELEQMPHILSASGASAKGLADHHLS